MSEEITVKLVGKCAICGMNVYEDGIERFTVQVETDNIYHKYCHDFQDKIEDLEIEIQAIKENSIKILHIAEEEIISALKSELTKLDLRYQSPTFGGIINTALSKVRVAIQIDEIKVMEEE